MDPDPDEHVYPGKEAMQWGPGVKEELVKGVVPTAKYSRVSEQARKLIADENMCSVFCGGKKCKYCTHEHWKPEQMAIQGLYSEWVTDNILAMARPSNFGFDNFKFLEQFEKRGIKTVINLQQPGEHAYCGYGNDSSGFSYNPQGLMDRNMYFYNFAWQDYGVAPMSTLLDIVKVMQFAVSEGKVAVHCHAGLGRTGLLIACYLVYCNRTKAGDAIHYVRSRRPGAIQTSQQVQAVFDFETHLKPFRTIFPNRISNEPEVSFKHFLNRQSHMLHGFEARRLRYIPKVIYICCERLLELAGMGQALEKVRTPSSFMPPTSGIGTVPRLSQITVRSENNLLEVFGAGAGRSKSFEDLTNTKFKQVLAGLHTDTSSTDLSQTDQDSATISDGSVQNDAKKENGKPTQSSVADGTKNHVKSPKMPQFLPSSDAEEDDDESIVFGKVDTSIASVYTQCESPSDLESCADRGVNVFSPILGDDKVITSASGADRNLMQPTPQANQPQASPVNDKSQQSKRLKKKPIRERLKSCFTRKLEEESEANLKSGSSILCTEVCKALAATEYSDEARTKANSLETQLNETEETWNSLVNETDPAVLSAIMWDWLDQLKEPVLMRQDLIHLLEKSDALTALRHLERSVKQFIEYLAIVVSKLLPQSNDLELCLVERLLSQLTHQVVKQNIVSFTAIQYQPTHWGEMKSNDASKLIGFFFRLMEELGGTRSR